jgi:hypothetical protein
MVISQVAIMTQLVVKVCVIEVSFGRYGIVGCIETTVVVIMQEPV